MNYPKECQFKVEKIHGNENISITLYSGITTFVGPNAAGKTQTLKALRNYLKSSLNNKVRYLSSNRIGTMESYRSKVNHLSYSPDNFNVGSRDDKKQRIQIETATGDFFTMDEKKDVFIKVAERLSVLFKRQVYLRWDSGNLKVFFEKTETQKEYSVVVEASGLVNVISILAALFDKDVDVLLIDEPEVSLHIALTEKVDESFAVKKELLSELALVLGILPQKTDAKELIAAIKQAKGSSVSLFDYEIIEENHEKGVNVSLKSNILEVSGFPFKIFCGQNVNEIVDRVIRAT